MQKFVEGLLYAIVIIVVLFLTLNLVDGAQAADYSQVKELYMPNEAGGVIALTKEPCAFPEAVKKGFDSRAYATEGNSLKHEGCWFAPSTAEAPVSEGITIIPIVNTWWDGDVFSFMQNQFSPDAKSVEVVPTL